MRATKEFLNDIDVLAEQKKQSILNARDAVSITGTTYYVSNAGNDDADGTTPETAWATLAKVTAAPLQAGDGVRFRRGDTFRGCVITRPGVTYCAYGEGDKPRLYSWDKNLAESASLWELVDAEHHIWRLTEPILDCGTLVFNEGEYHSRKLIPSYIGGKFVCRDDESRDFDVAAEMTQDLDIFCAYTERTTTVPSKGQDFPIPVIDDKSFGELYLRCDRGNPAEVFDSIEAAVKRNMLRVGDNRNVRIDNLCLKYIGAHAVSAGGHCVGLHVTNCEIGWIGGTIQHYMGTDPNYPQGVRGSVTRYGNGVEIYGGCEDYLVKDNYIYQCYDAGITHQFTSTPERVRRMVNVRYLDNLVEYCVYSIEYFLEKLCGDTESYMDDIVIAGNVLRYSGYGWGQQRHNTHTPAHIKGWSYENTASHYVIYDNVFDRAAYRMVHLVAKYPESLPVMSGNTYIQQNGLTLGQYGANVEVEPPVLTFDGEVEATIADVFGEEDAKVYMID